MPCVAKEQPPSNASLHGEFFYSTELPVCISFLPKNKTAGAKRGLRDRRKQPLFIDARKLGTLIDRVRCELTVNYHQLRTLTNLLPKLLSGEISTQHT